MTDISHKISKVSDDICKDCNQLWEGECCAFQVPHSIEELEYRKKSPGLKCSILSLRRSQDADVQTVKLDTKRREKCI